MKLYHEIAHVHNGREFAGFILRNKDTKKLFCCSVAEFRNLCKESQVDYFGWDAKEDTYTIEYSKEELKELGKSAKLINNFNTVESYFANDIRVPLEHFEQLQKNPEVIVAPAVTSRKFPIMGGQITFLLIGDEMAICNFVNGLPKEYKRLCSYVKDETYFILCEKLWSLLREHFTANDVLWLNSVLFSTEDLENPENAFRFTASGEWVNDAVVVMKNNATANLARFKTAQKAESALSGMACF